MIATIISYPNNTLNDSIDVLPSLVSSEMIRNLNITVPPNEEYIEVNYNGETITLLIKKECRYQPINIIFQNKEGAECLLTLFKKSVESLSVTSETFESDNGQPSEGNHQFTTYNVQGKSKFSVNSGFVDESMNEIFKQLLLSERVWRLDGSIYTPLTITSKNFEYKTQRNDRLINYNIEFEYAFNEINNV